MLSQLQPRATTYVLTRGVRQYRSTIERYVNRADTVLELGCAFGTTTHLLSQRTPSVVGVDKSYTAIQRARRSYPALRFEHGDAFDLQAMLRLGPGFTKIYLDLSGSRPPERILGLARGYAAALHPQVIVIKNSTLKRFVSNCVVWE